MAKKPQPAVTRLWFHIDPTNLTNFIDLSLAVSAANRRFVRQGTTFAVAGMTLHTASTVTGQFDVSKVPDTWVAEQAYKKSKMLWMKSQDQVLDDQPTIAARYRDFKVYLDGDMVGAPVQGPSSVPAMDGDILLPVDRQNFGAKSGEWTYSAIQLPRDGGSLPPLGYTMHFVGANTGSSLSMISGYGLSRSRPQEIDPNTPTVGGWMNDVFDVADNLDEIRIDITDDNDVPPYRVGPDSGAGSDLEFYPGGVNNQPSSALHSVAFVSGTTVGGKTRVEGGTFNCGLIRFDWSLAGTAPMYLSIDLIPGMNKGYLAEAY